MEEPKEISARITVDDLDFKLASRMPAEEFEQLKTGKSSVGENLRRNFKDGGPCREKEALVAYMKGRPVCTQAYRILEDGFEARAMGLDTVKELQGRGTGKIMREAVYQHLEEEGIREFTIPIQPWSSSQDFAGSDISQNQVPREKIKVEGGDIKEYTINVQETKPRFQRGKIRWENR